MQKIHINEPIVGLPAPSIEDEGNLIFTYFDVFDDVFKTELNNGIKFAKTNP